MVVEEEPDQSKMVDKRQEEEEEVVVVVVGGAMEGRGLVGKNMRSKEAANHRRHRHLRLIIIISITTITTIMAEQRAARSPSQRHRYVSVCVSMHKILDLSNYFQEKPAQKQVQLFSHLPQFERDKILSRTLEYV